MTAPIVVDDGLGVHAYLSRQLDLLVAEVESPPAAQWAQLGMPVATCPSVAVGAPSVRSEAVQPGDETCGVFTVVEIVGGIVRECGIQHDDAGQTVPALVEATSTQSDADTDALARWARALDRPPGATFSVTYSVEGGLSYVVGTTSSYAW